MEKGVLQDDDKQLFRCTCKSPQCAHCSLHEALMRDNLNELGAYIAEGEDKDSDALPHSESMHTMVDGAQSGAAKKLKLPCRRNSRSLSSSLAFPAHDRLSKSWPPLPLVRASSVDSVMYTDACVDLQKSEKKLDSSMLTITSSSFEDEQEIMSTHPVLLQHQFTPPKKSSKLSSSLQGATNPRRICRYCNREFPSGRALGGHMRVHGGLDADRLQVMNHPMPERQQFNESMGRSSSPLANSKPGDHYAEVNCLVSGSKFVNSNGGGVFRRRINSEESIIRGADERKSAPCRGVMDKCVPVHHTAERDSLQKNEKLGKGIKDQSVIKKGGFTLKRESNFSVMQKSIDRYADDFTEKHVNDDDDGGYDDLYSSKLMVLGNASEVAPQGTMESLVSECVLDEGNPPHKLRPNPRPSRRCLWTDRGDAIADNNKESSGRRSSSPPTLHGLSADHVSSERARPCSECGKVFWSWKALFGHMRCHPEREWRGIQRPDASSSELDNKQARACRKLSSLSLLAGKDELETELESDAENRGACKPTQATLSVSTSAKAEGFNAHKEDGEEIELIKGLDSSKGAEGLQKAEESSMKGGAKRALKSTLLEEPANDDLAPSAWPTRKRSRRSRANGGAGAMAISTALAEPALTSETATSSELRDNEKVSIKDLQEDLDMANCLVLLSSAGNKVQGSEKHHVQSTQESALRKLGSGTNFGHSEHVDAVSCKGEGGDDGTDEGLNDDSDENEVENFIAMSKRPNSAGSAMKYECSTCKRCFKSHQALGGHRASHRKTKGCFALMNEHAEETMQESKEDNIADVDEFVSSELNEWKAMGNMLSVAPPLHHQQDEGRSPFILAPSTVDRLPATFGSKKKKFKGHACSICHRIFPSGQALGGHKRCHWTGEKVAESGSMAASSSNNNNNNTRVFLQEQAEWGGEANGDTKIHQAKRGKEDGIDLNLPAPLDEEDEAYDHAGLSSTDAMDPEVQNGVEGAELDGEEDTEGHLVDYIGGKRRSLNGLSREWLAEGGSRRRETAW